MISRSARKTSYIKSFQSISLLCISWPILGVFFVPPLISYFGIVLLLGWCGFAGLASARIQQAPHQQRSAFIAGLVVAAAGVGIGMAAVLTVAMFTVPTMMLSSMFTIPFTMLSNTINFMTPNLMFPIVSAGVTMFATAFSYFLGGLAATGVGGLLFHFGLNPFIEDTIVDSIEGEDVLINDEVLQNNGVGNTQSIQAGLGVQNVKNSERAQENEHNTAYAAKNNRSATSNMTIASVNPNYEAATVPTERRGRWKR